MHGAVLSVIGCLTHDKPLLSIAWLTTGSNHVDHGHALDVELGKAVGAPERRLCGLPLPVLAGVAYCTASASMVLLNKFALSSFDFHSITMLLLFQCIFCVVAVYLTSVMGLIKLEVGAL